MKNLTLENLLAICGGRYFGPYTDMNQEVTAITTDSRQITKGCLFIAIKGARADGHAFISQAFADGAACVIAEQYPETMEGPVILADSSLQAIQDIAEFYLAGMDIPVVGITGSVGKTSTKEMIASVLSQKYRVLKTEGNFNNALGLPLTIFRLREEDEVAVLEMGISDFGEMHRLARIARPDVCVITNIGYCHLENLKDRDGVLAAKSEIFDFLPEDGSIIVNGDDDKLSQIKKTAGVSPCFFGMEDNGVVRHVHAERVEAHGLDGISCRIYIGGQFFDAHISSPGEHMVYNAMAAAAVGERFGLSIEEIRKGIEEYRTISGRLRKIEQEGLTIIDDCYNANPVSMKASLNVLGGASGRRVALLGDMGELGEHEKLLHAGIGKYIVQTGCADVLCCVGTLCKEMADAAREEAAISQGGKNLQILHFESKDELEEQLDQIIHTGDTVLLKASHFMQFEQLLTKLKQLC